MLNKLLVVTLRRFLRDKTHTAINIAGLTLGLTCSILIAMYVYDESHYDQFHSDGDRLYRVTQSMIVNGEQTKNLGLEYPVAPLLKEIGEVEAVARIINPGRFMVGQQLSVRVGDFVAYENNFSFADPAVFNVLSIPLSVGDPANVLADLNSIVISEDAASKYFGSENPIGKTLRLNQMTDFKVTGVIGRFPGPTHLHFDFIAHIDAMKQADLPRPKLDMKSNWILNWFWTYVKLKDADDVNSFRRQLTEFTRRHYPAIHQSNQVTLHLQPIRDIHLDNSYASLDLTPSGNTLYVYTFATIAVLIMLIACVNFINLTTARVVQRSRELGMRKVLGADRYEIIQQIFLESFLQNLIALSITLAVIELILPYFNAFSGKLLALDYSLGNPIFLLVLGIALVTGILSGLYPAWVFSNIRPVSAFRKEYSSGRSAQWIRRLLVIFQFSVSIILLVGTFTVYRQLNFLQNASLGFEKEHIALVPIRGTSIVSKYDSFKEQLNKSPSVVAVSGVNAILGTEVRYTSFKIDGIAEPQIINVTRVEYDFIRTFGLELTDGRDFDRSISTDFAEGFIVNETAVRKLGLKNPIGTGMRFLTIDGAKPGRIIGVIKDYHARSLHTGMDPMVLALGSFGYVAVKFHPDALQTGLHDAETVWRTMEPDKPFSFSFLDDRLMQQYLIEQKTAKLEIVFSVLAVFIACLGLIGLASYSAERRKKEIGIRKVLGASIIRVIFNLSSDFGKLILIANAIAWPLAYLFLIQWLERFAYHESIPLWSFIASGMIVLFVGLATVVIQSWRTASANPIHALKYE